MISLARQIMDASSEQRKAKKSRKNTDLVHPATRGKSDVRINTVKALAPCFVQTNALECMIW